MSKSACLNARKNISSGSSNMNCGSTPSICTKACLQSPAGKEKRDQTNESSKAGIGLFVASCDASESLEMAEEVFDQMAPFVHFCIVRDALGPVGLGGNDRDCAAFVQVGTQPVVVEGFVADQGLKI